MSDELIERCALVAHHEYTRIGAWDQISEEFRVVWRNVARAVLEAAAPPTPPIPGVSELLAECDRVERESRGFDDVVPTRKIVRLLAPEGGQP